MNKMKVGLRMNKVIVIIGPTASGKTAVSIELALLADGEIVSADSMQIYKYMDIGTAKPDEIEKKGVPHYLIDEKYPDEEFSVAAFKDLAEKYIRQILQKGKIPIVVGGTGLYISSLINNIDFCHNQSDPKIRQKYLKLAEAKGGKYLHDLLCTIDRESYERIHPNDIKRLARALEVYEITGKPLSEHHEASRIHPPEFEYRIFGLRMDRDKLYERINKRVDKMIENGLINEVRKLMEMGYDKCSVAMQGLGYKEILSYLRGETTFEEAVYILKRDTRRFAKRQLTWFRRMENVTWIDIENDFNPLAVAKKIIVEL